MAPADKERADGATDELERLLALASELRELIPPDLEARLSEAAYELLLALRELLDWLLTREQEQREQPAEVQDIPIL
jgi:hypothetical protein